METIKNLLDFLRKPVYETYSETGFRSKMALVIRLLALALFLSLAIGMIITIIEGFFNLELGEHAMNELFEEYDAIFILVVVTVLAPLIEELIFRGPLYLFRNSSYFGLIFYLFALVFGFYHITNFEITPTILCLSPLLVAPQLTIGLILGYLRVKLGLAWAMILHALYNFVLIGPLVLAHALEIRIP
jgi:membrane protease YdiL (CAAX protease family)